jgi:fatty acid amide hydrolase
MSSYLVKVNELLVKLLQNQKLPKILTFTVLLYFGYKVTSLIYKLIKSSYFKKKWASIAYNLQKEKEAKIRLFLNSHNISEERIEYITTKDATTLSKLIKEEVISSVEAVIAFCIRTSKIGLPLNLIANINFEEALKQAEICDEIIKKWRQSQRKGSLPPMLGVPISVKDHISVKGIPQTIGFAALHNHYREKDCLLVKILKQKGAIIICSSNTPQGLFSIESSNFLHGVAKNPWNVKKTPGGSSGGEAGLVSSHCSAMGIGSDMAGSLRIPAAYCGCYSFKPTSTRISKLGICGVGRNDIASSNIIATSIGPITRSIDDLILFAKNIYGEFLEDPYVYNCIFKNESFENMVEKSNKKIAYMINLPGIESSPAIQNVMNHILSKLKEKHYDIQEFQFPELENFYSAANNVIFNSNILKEVIDLAEGEELQYYFKPMFLTKSLTQPMLKLATFILNLIGEKRLSKDLSKIKMMNLDEYVHNIKVFFELRAKFIQYWKDNDFDGMITPIMPFPAHDFGLGPNLMPLAKFNYLFNCTDMPATCIPIKLCDDFSYPNSHNDFVDKNISKIIKTSHNLPIAIQVATLPNQDEQCLALAKEIDLIERYDINHSHKIHENLKEYMTLK